MPHFGLDYVSCGFRTSIFWTQTCKWPIAKPKCCLSADCAQKGILERVPHAQYVQIRPSEYILQAPARRVAGFFWAQTLSTMGT